MKRVSRCRTVLTHLFISWVMVNIVLIFVLYFSFHFIPWYVVGSMMLFTLGLKIMQYDLWKVYHDRFRESHRTRATDHERNNNSSV